MISTNGNPVANQFVVETEDGKYFQSYDKVIAYIDNNGKILLDIKYWNYSRTTGKYRSVFLGESKAETLAKITSGKYPLKDLNKISE